MNDLQYLASPYSHKDAWMRELRFKAVSRVAGLLYLERKVRTFCPIAHSHPVAMELTPQNVHPHWQVEQTGPDPTNAEFWLGWDEAFNPACVGLIVCMLPGWDRSTGVAAEIPLFEGAGKPVEKLNPRHWFSLTEWQMLEAGVEL